MLSQSAVSVPLGAMGEELGATKEEWDEQWDGADQEKGKAPEMSTTKKKKMRHAWKWMVTSPPPPPGLPLSL